MTVKTVHINLHCYLYKITCVSILFSDLPIRYTFAVDFFAFMEVVNELPWNIFWAKEAHFYLQSFVNTQNFREWEAKYASFQKPVWPKNN